MSSRIHHLDCGTMCPYAVGGSRFVCHVLLIEHDAGLVLIDSGYGLADIAEPERIGPIRHLLRPVLDPAHSAIRQVSALGFSPGDVRHIVLTHLDVDHAGALGDFPHAEVHLLAAEHAAATEPPTLAERLRYVPEQWSHGPLWRLHDPDGERWEGFDSVRPLSAFGDDLALVPLAGHTRGHAAVAVRTDTGWILHAGDAFFHRAELGSAGPSRTIRAFRRMAAVDDSARAANLDRLRTLHRSTVSASQADRIRVFCAHDAEQFDEFAPTDQASR